MLLRLASSIPKPSGTWFTSPCWSRQNKQDVRLGFQYQVGKVTDFDFQSQAIYITTAMDISFQRICIFPHNLMRHGNKVTSPVSFEDKMPIIFRVDHGILMHEKSVLVVIIFRVDHGILMHEKSVLVVMWKICHIFVLSLHTFSVEQSFGLIFQYTKLVVCMCIRGIQVSHCSVNDLFGFWCPTYRFEFKLWVMSKVALN